MIPPRFLCIFQWSGPIRRQQCKKTVQFEVNCTVLTVNQPVRAVSYFLLDSQYVLTVLKPVFDGIHRFFDKIDPKTSDLSLFK